MTRSISWSLCYRVACVSFQPLMIHGVLYLLLYQKFKLKGNVRWVVEITANVRNILRNSLTMSAKSRSYSMLFDHFNEQRNQWSVRSWISKAVLINKQENRGYKIYSSVALKLINSSLLGFKLSHYALKRCILAPCNCLVINDKCFRKSMRVIV